MNDLNLLLAQNKDFTFYGCQFDTTTSKTYHYKSLEVLEIGDRALVLVGGEVTVVTIVQTDCLLDITEEHSYKWLIGKIDFTLYEDCLAMEAEVKKRINTMRLNQLRGTMQQTLLDNFGEDGVEELKKLVHVQ